MSNYFDNRNPNYIPSVTPQPFTRTLPSQFSFLKKELKQKKITELRNALLKLDPRILEPHQQEFLKKLSQ